MPVSIYAATIPVFRQILECQSSLVHKAASHADAKNIPHDKILRARRAPADQSFRAHVRLGTREAVKAVSMLTGQAAQIPRGSAEDFAGLARYVASATQYLNGIKEDHFVGCENKEFLVRSQSVGETMCDAVELVFSHTYPVFYYHAVSAHAILMQHGVSVSKWEFQNPPG